MFTVQSISCWPVILVMVVLKRRIHSLYTCTTTTSTHSPTGIYPSNVGRVYSSVLHSLLTDRRSTRRRKQLTSCCCSKLAVADLAHFARWKKTVFMWWIHTHTHKRERERKKERNIFLKSVGFETLLNCVVSRQFLCVYVRTLCQSSMLSVRVSVSNNTF